MYHIEIILYSTAYPVQRCCDVQPLAANGAFWPEREVVDVLIVGLDFVSWARHLSTTSAQTIQHEREICISERKGHQLSQFSNNLYPTHALPHDLICGL